MAATVNPSVECSIFDLCCEDDQPQNLVATFGSGCGDTDGETIPLVYNPTSRYWEGTHMTSKE